MMLTPVLAPDLVLDLIPCLLMYHHETMTMMYEDKNDDVMMTMMVVIVIVFVVIQIDFHEGHCCDRGNPGLLIVLPAVHVVWKVLVVVVVVVVVVLAMTVLALVLVCEYPRKKEHDDRVPNAPYHAQEMMKMGT